MKQLANTVGCDDDETATGNKCSTAATLDDNDFTYGGQTYSVTAVQLGSTNPALSITISGVGTTPQTLGALRFRADNYSHALADAQTFILETFFFPTNPGWSVGNSVELKLVKRYWTGVDLYGGDMVRDADGYQYMDLNEGAFGLFSVRLTQAPTATVTVRIGKLATFGIDDFDAVASIEPQTLTFTTSNWQTGQSVLLIAATDGDAADDRIIIAAFVSIAAGANTFDPYRSPDRVNGFVLTVIDAQSSSNATGAELGRLKRPEEAQPQPQVLANNPPTVAAPLADLIEPAIGGGTQIDLLGVFADADGDALAYSASTTNEDISYGFVQSSELLVVALGRGTATITVTADDGNGGTVSDAFTVTVKEAPTVARPIADIGSLEAGASRQVTLSGVFTDADGDRLTFSASSSDTAVATAAVGSGGLTVTARQAGTATITVTARDTDGNQVSDTFDVTVIARPEPQAEASASEPEQEQDVVARYDANKDGVISLSEFRAAVAALYKDVSLAELVRIRQAWVDGGYKQ